MTLPNRFALVTGASSGIGAAYAEQLALRGYNLILVARRKDRLEDLASRLAEAHGRKVVVHAADLTEAGGLLGVEHLLTERDDVDMLVNNAGVGALGPSGKVGPDALEALLQINVVALTRLAVAAAAAFSRRGGGRIINIASIVGLIPNANSAAYGASKAYVLNFSRSQQMEYQAANVVVQAVMPGPVRTEFFDVLGSSPFPDHLFMTADELAATALTALDRGELVCFPNLEYTAAWSAFEEARKALVQAVMVTGSPASRYRQHPNP